MTKEWMCVDVMSAVPPATAKGESKDRTVVLSWIKTAQSPSKHTCEGKVLLLTKKKLNKRAWNAKILKYGAFTV